MINNIDFLGLFPLWWRQLLVYFICVNLITFLVYKIDKKAAIQKSRRVSEDMLHFLAIIGGSIGAFYAQRVLRHKTQKEPFKTISYVIIYLQFAGIIWCLEQAYSR